MIPNPFAIQRIAESKLAEARRQAEEDRLLVPATRQRSARTINWSMAAMVAGAVTLMVLIWL